MRWLLLGALLAWLWPLMTYAHAFDPAVLEIRDPGAGAGETTFEVALRVPSALAARSAAPVRPRWPAGCALAEPAGDGNLGPWRLRCPAGSGSAAALGIDGLDGAQAEVLVHLVAADGSERAGVLHGDADRFPLRIAPPGERAHGSPSATVSQYLLLGVRHILLGFDHLAFLAALFLLVGGLASLVRAVTAFTLAHSLTLALSATGLLVLPQPPVEALIAASVLLLCVELARPAAGLDGPDRPSLLRRAPALAALLFGLLHGLGFAAALAEAGMPSDRAPLALLGFNLGVEVGQLAVLALVLVPARAMLRRLWATASSRGPAYVLGALSAAWLIERAGAVLTVGAAP